MFKMYNGATLINYSHIPLSDQGGRGSVVSFSSNPPTVSEPPVVKTKRFRRGDINPSDGTIFWCYERSKRAGGSVYIRERWMTPQRYEAQREWKKLLDAQYMKGQAYKAGAGRRAEAQKRWKQSERGRALIKANRDKSENREKSRLKSQEYHRRSEVIARRKQYEATPERRAAAKERYEKLKENRDWVRKQNERSRRYRQENKERVKELQRRWREQNPGKGNEYIKRRYAEDPQFALAYKVRARVYQAIQKGGASKTGRTEELVGCSFDFLRQHIERQFNGKMSWDKPGSFHIDHIIPLAAFDLTDPAQLKVACNWQNMRPLSPRKNMSKGAKLLHPQQQLPLSVHSTTFNTQAV